MSASDAERTWEYGESDQWPNDRNPIFFTRQVYGRRFGRLNVARRPGPSDAGDILPDRCLIIRLPVPDDAPEVVEHRLDARAAEQAGNEVPDLRQREHGCLESPTYEA